MKGTAVTTVEHWREWQWAASLAQCSAETRTALQAFVWQRWQKYLRACGGEANPERGELTREEVWHRFEADCFSHAPAGHASYKDWLFDRLLTHTGPPKDVIESGVSLRVRDVVRDYLSKEGRTRLPGEKDPAPSMEGPVPGTDGALTLDDLIGVDFDVRNQVALREYLRLGQEEAAALFGLFDERERLVLAADGLGMPLSHPEIEELAGRKRTVLYRTLKSVAYDVRRHIDRKYVVEGETERRVLVLATMRALADLSGEPKPPETWQEALFALVEGS